MNLSRASSGLLNGLGLLLCGFFLFPLVFMAVAALNPDELDLLKNMSGLGAFWPSANSSLENFQDVLTQSSFLRSFLNSLLIVSLTVILGILCNSMLAYSLARFEFKAKNWLLSAIVGLIIIPFEAVAVPLLLLVNQLPWMAEGQWVTGWLDSYHVQILPFIGHAFSVYLFYQFFVALPKDLEEAALLDGASYWRIYWSIVMPLCKPVIATVVVLQFLARWGELLWPVMVVRGDTFATLPLSMQTFFGQYPRQWGDIMAFATLATLPTLLVFIAFQRWFVKSAIASGIKS